MFGWRGSRVGVQFRPSLSDEVNCAFLKFRKNRTIFYYVVTASYL